MSSGYCPECGKWVTLIQEPAQRYWAIRGDRVRKSPSPWAGTAAWMKAKDIVDTDGQVVFGGKEQYFEITLQYLGRSVTGYAKAECFEPYVPPTLDDDPSNPMNASKIFDLDMPVVRLPEDYRITQAVQAGRKAQYIDVRDLGAKKPYNVNLCGEFCAAAINGVDVSQLLQKWLASGYKYAPGIIRDDKVTNVNDLKSMIDSDRFTVYPTKYDSSFPISPLRICRGIGISGCAITPSGSIDPTRGSIRHWVVIEDVTPVGTSGWVRVYNPMTNASEVYNFDVYAQTNPGYILWMVNNGS